MESLSVKCPNCTGETDVEPGAAQAFCQYCGTVLSFGKSYSQTSTKEMHSDSDTELLAIKQVEDQYFAGKREFNDVLAAYNMAQLAGAMSSDYWLARARFYAAGNIREFEAGNISAAQRSMVIDQYTFWMDNAIANYVGNAIKLKIEKEQTIGNITNAFKGPKIRPAKIRNQNLIDEIKETDLRYAPEKFEQRNETPVAAETTKKKTRQKMIIIAGIVLLVLVGILMLRSCRNNDDGSIEDYEAFLELSYVQSLFYAQSSRADILDLNVNFTNQNTTSPTLNVVAPLEANLDTIIFYFDESDILEQVVIHEAAYFNDFAASAGFSADLRQYIADNFEIDEVNSENEQIITFIAADVDVVLTLQTELFTIDISARVSDDELTEQQREVWDLIEARIAEGYDSWSELVIWATEQDISFLAYDEGERPEQDLLALINEHGLLGDYTHATPGVGSITDPDEVILILYFENLSYNDTVAELSALNRYSNSELTEWLDHGGRARLESYFAEVELIDLDDDGVLITQIPEIVEFVNWEIEYLDRFMPVGAGRIRIERTFRVLEIVEDADEDPDELELGAGIWEVGYDIAEGRYEVAGSGNFILRRDGNIVLNELLGEGFGVGSITTYLLDGDEIDLRDINNVSFRPVDTRSFSTTLTTGNWVVGVDIGAGQYDVTTPHGTGTIVIWRGDQLMTNEILADASFGVDPVRVDLDDDDFIIITGLETVNFD